MQEARRAFERYHHFLNSEIGVVFKGKALTNWDIIETVLYGNLAHVNDDKRPAFEEWRRAAPFETVVEFCYENAIATVVRFITACQDFNQKLLARLASDGTSER